VTASNKLAYLVSQYPAVNHTFILREIRELRQLGFDVRVISIRSVDRPLAALVPEELDEYQRTYYIKTASIGTIIGDHLATGIASPISYMKGLLHAIKLAPFRLREGLRHLGYFGQAVMVGRWMHRQGLRHVHTHFSSTVALFVNKVFPITFSMTMHGPDEFRDPAGFFLREKIGAASFVCAISDFARLQLEKCSPQSEWEKIEVARLGVDLSVFAPRPVCCAPERLEVLCVGRLAPAKAQHILIAAVERLIRSGRRLRLRLVGDGPDRKKLEDLVRQFGLTDCVAFEGSLNQTHVQELYAQTDLFVLSSFAEGVPVVLMEAMAMQIPCIATKIAGVPELIRDGVDGLLVAAGDEAGLAEAIARLQDDAALRKSLGKSARQRVNDEYNLHINVAHLGQVFRSRLART